MRRSLRRAGRLVAKPVRGALRGRPAGALEGMDERADAARGERWAAGQILRHLHPDLGGPESPREALARAECRVWSQNGEDGVLAHLFAAITPAGRTFVEFGVGDGTQCCSANLALGFGWSGLMMERDPAGVAAARRFYAARKEVLPGSVRVAEAVVRSDNIDELLRSGGAAGPIDLLSIDIDGNDYWVWEAVTAVDPRVVVIEYNGSLGPQRSITVAYDPEFDRMSKHPSGYYHGASLAALARLGAAKGYVLAGCESTGVNAFFVRRDAAEGRITPQTVEEAFYPNVARAPYLTPEEQFALISRLPWVEV
ncbi:MAG: hypothetical protein HY775_02950 [Acidobacteria bacterium]|nr:hypothetical protein [Acidobacteriota bacterium]